MGIYDFPIGKVMITAKNGCINGLYFAAEGSVHEAVISSLTKGSVSQGIAGKDHNDNGKDDPVIKACVDQLKAYFDKKLKVFDLPLLAEGTDFRMKVWDALKEISYGETISYKELAQRIGNPAAIRAVGGANHNNPISIIIPCHRVIGADGQLTGYGGGLDTKKYLLDLEGAVRK